ncbi:MAG: hypothetical protein EHM42_14970 [Planctomycetaceae bacterium]|nr:MAG: hypothetical protein EHM42_14970 [Planctomycetaceae bacterium]
MNYLGRLARCGIARGILLLTVVSGCESSGWNSRMLEAFSPEKSASAEDEERHRTAYAQSRNRDDLYWLLANRVDAGMGLREVNGVLGEEGTRETHGQWARGGDFQVSDDVYRYGPDSTGQSVYLVFREGRLVNYDRSDFTKGAALDPARAAARR